MTSAHAVRSIVATGLLLSLTLPLANRPTVAQDVGTVIVEARDKFDAPLPGACFALQNSTGQPVEACDNGPADADAAEGLVAFTGVAPGDLTVSTILIPAGYQPLGDLVHVVQLDSGGSARVVFTFTADQSDDSAGLTTLPRVDAQVQPADVPHQPVAVTPPSRISLAPTCAGVKATIVVATNAGGVPTNVTGTNGDDVIVGTAGPDLIDGLGGHDLICSFEGDDVVDAGPGDDWVDAGGGDDHVYGHDGADALAGGDGDDVLKGLAGSDRLDGGAGRNDYCHGGTERDKATNCETAVAIP
jgi:hypothetical protein